MPASMVEKTSASWSALGYELKHRTAAPLSHASYVQYFITAVILAGGAGVWLELFQLVFPDPSAPACPPATAALRVAIITFFPALAGSSCMQLILAEEKKALKAFALLVMSVSFVVALIIGQSRISSTAALSVGVLASIFSLWIWWIANSNQQDILDPDAPIGKDTSSELAGSLEGYQA